jgi:hypothetical protein
VNSIANPITSKSDKRNQLESAIGPLGRAAGLGEIGNSKVTPEINQKL